MKKFAYLLMLIFLAFPLCACSPQKDAPTKVELTKENYQKYIEFNTSLENFSYYEYDSKTYVVGVYKLYAAPQYNYTFDHVVITYSVYDGSHSSGNNTYVWEKAYGNDSLYLDYSGMGTSSFVLYREKALFGVVVISPISIDVVVDKIEGYIIIN